MLHHATPRLSLVRTTLLSLGMLSAGLLAGLASGCSEAGEQALISTSSGESHEEAQPRIAALLPFAADQLIAMGVTPAAVPQISGDVPETWEGIPTVMLDHSAGPNLEQLIAADADIVITSGIYGQFLTTMKESTGAEVIPMDVESVGDVAEHIRTLGDLTGHPDEAEARIAEIEAALPAADESGKPVKVLAVLGSPHAFYAYLPGSYLGNLIARAGGELITRDMESHSVYKGMAPLSMEAVLDRDPDQILVLFHGPEDSARALLSRDPLWSKLRAVESGQVVFLNEDLYTIRPGSDMPAAAKDIQGIIDAARQTLP